MDKENKMPKVFFILIVLAIILAMGYFLTNTGNGDIALNIDQEGEGEIDPSPGTYFYEEGEEITIKAVPAEGWNFRNWTGDIEDTDAQISVILDGPKELKAVFEEEIAPDEVSAEDLDMEIQTLVPGAYNIIITYERTVDLFEITEGDSLQLNINGDEIELEYDEEREEYYQTNLQGYTENQLRESIVTIK